MIINIPIDEFEIDNSDKNLSTYTYPHGHAHVDVTK
jgi:hypothetical protein